MKELSEDQKALLRKPLPCEAVKQHPTKTYLSSIKAIYVIERLNEVFGIGKWKLLSEIIDNKTSMIVVKARLIIEEYGIDLESYGGNDNGGEGSKNFDLGDAYKGATTDALTKICSFLEIGIDVFKGKITHKNTTSSEPKPKDNRPFINKAQVDKVIEKIRSGDKEAKDKCYKAFQVNSEFKKLIDEA